MGNTSTMRITKSAFGFSILMSFIASFPVSAVEPVPELVRVPVFFVTDRNLQSSSADSAEFGPHRKYLGDCQHDPYMGTGFCVVENVAHKALTPDLLAIGWKPAESQEGVGAHKIVVETGTNFDEIQNKFYTNLAEKTKESENKNIVLFAHGYKNSFESAWQTAAKFSYQFESPVVLYSWPSAAKVRSYTSDENNIEWSQEHFNDVVQKLEETCNASSIHLRLYAHSMGSRLLVRATPLLREKHHILEFALICPDVDQGLVKHYARRYLSTKGTSKIRLYMSQRDKALALSQIVHGGYCRLGECADSIASMASNALLSQKDKTALKESDKEFQERMEKTKHRMQTIDFTNFDRGAIGHKIPVEVVKNMAYTDAPGPGYSLIDEKSGQRSRASKVFSKVTGLSKQNLNIAGENCLRLVKEENAERNLTSARAHGN